MFSIKIKKTTFAAFDLKTNSPKYNAKSCPFALVTLDREGV